MKRERTERAFDREIKGACQVLKNDGVVLYPSDTLWGIGGDAENLKVVERINAIKKRPDSKNMIVLVSSERMLQQVVKDVPPIVWDILDNGTEAISIIYPKASARYGHLSPKDGSIAVRLVKSGFAHDFIAYYDKPLISTSANISGDPSPVHFEEISDSITDNVDYIFPNECASELSGKASHLLSVAMNGEIRIYR